MSVGDRWWDPNANADAALTDTGATDTGATDTTASAGKPTVQDLGNGYSLVTWTDEFGMPKSQIVPNKDAASVAAVEAAKIGAGAAGTSAAITTQGANQRAAAQAEIDKAKNAADEAHNAALLALQNGNAAEARRQFDISQQELQRYHSADIAARQQDQQLAASKFGNDVYNKLTDLASNPRNFMEQFFRIRGQPAPPGSAAYGNTSVTGPGLATFEQFLPNFLRATGLGGSGGGYGAQQTASSYSSGQTSNSGPGYAAANTGDNRFLPNGQIQLSANDPDAQKLLAAHPGQYVLQGASSTGATAPSAPAASTGTSQLSSAGQSQLTDISKIPGVQLSPWAKAQMGGVPAMAGGGSVTMTAPHALVNLLSGKVAAIAGEAGKEKATFDGAAIIEPKEGIAGISPDGGTTTSNDSPVGYISGFSPGAGAGMGGGGGGGGSLPAASTTSSSSVITPEMQAYIDEQNALTALHNTAATPVTTTTQADTTTAPDQFVTQASTGTGLTTQPNLSATIGKTSGITPAQQAEIDAANAAVAAANAKAKIATTTTTTSPFELPTGVATGPVTDTAPNPGPSPSPILTPINIPNPATTFNVPDFLRETPSGLGKNPKFLPENLASEDPIIAQMLQQGAFPPFLQRIFAQKEGLAGLGTNVPQQTDLPPGVPLVSKLAYSSMTPSEQQAFISFISAHGLTPEDYFSLVEAASPQGGAGSKNPSIPQFLRQ